MQSPRYKMSLTATTVFATNPICAVLTPPSLDRPWSITLLQRLRSSVDWLLRDTQPDSMYVCKVDGSVSVDILCDGGI